MKRLLLDVETAPNTAHVWGLFKQNIGVNQLLETGRVMCASYKWIGDRKAVFVSEWDHGHETTIRTLHKICADADAIITYNGDKFDIPTLNKEFIKYGLTPPAPSASIDLYKTAKGRFKFVSNRMDHLAKELGHKGKVRHEGHELWIKCMKGERKAQKHMERYNRGDIHVLEFLYGKMQPWVVNHPNWGLFNVKNESPVCPYCGGDSLIRRGVQNNKTLSYQRYHCDTCGGWSRSRKTDTPKNTAVVVPIT